MSLWGWGMRPGGRKKATGGGGGGGGGAGVEYIDDPLTSDDNVTTFSDGGSWVFGANGAEHDTGGFAKGYIVWGGAGNASPVDNASLSITWHSIVSTGENANWELHVLVDGVTGASAQRPENSFYVQLDYQTARLYKQSASSNTELDTAAITAIGAGDTLKIVVVPNGDNYDVTAYINDTEILSATNISHDSLGTASAFRHESAAAGWDGVVKNAYGESAA